jgi:hypothetical protein
MHHIELLFYATGSTFPAVILLLLPSMILIADMHSDIKEIKESICQERDVLKKGDAVDPE